jgi:hypothetical protein
MAKAKKSAVLTTKRHWKFQDHDALAREALDHREGYFLIHFPSFPKSVFALWKSLQFRAVFVPGKKNLRSFTGVRQEFFAKNCGKRSAKRGAQGYESRF